jgi:undecaprenyl diphosphate synthase
MDLNVRALRDNAPAFVRDGIRIRYSGLTDLRIPPTVREEIRHVERATAAGSRLTVTVAFNHGGRAEIVDACRGMLRDGLDPEQLTEADVVRYLPHSDMPDIDLVVRTGGECRLSNFMLWRTAFAELVVVDTWWPDFGPAELAAAVSVFAGRDRRFGGVSQSA